MGRRGEHSKQEIQTMAIQAAERLVVRDGVSGLTARKVADAIGYTPGSLYTVFQNLDELALELNGRTLDELNQVLSAAVDVTPTAAVQAALAAQATQAAQAAQAINEDAAATLCRQQLIAMADGYIEFAHRHVNRWRMAFEHRLPQVETLPSWLQDKVDAIYALVANVLAPIVTTDKVLLAAATLWGNVHGLCTLTLNHKLELGGVKSIHTVIEFSVDNYLAGLAMYQPNGLDAKKYRM